MDPSLLEEIKSRLGRVIGDRWKLVKILGLGASAAVYRGVDRKRQRVAIKILHNKFQRSTVVRRRFFREQKILDELRHPNILRIFEGSPPDEAEAYIIMELLEGKTLAKMMSKRPEPLGADEVLGYMAPVLEVLAHCHARKIVHRDLKPANIFLTDSDVIKVLDFGVARFHLDGVQLTRDGTALGTPAFMSPEQATGHLELLDARSDIFSAGATMHFLLCGQYLHEGRTADETFVMAASTPAPSLAKRAPNLPRELTRLVDRAVAWDPDDRWQSASLMLHHLRELQNALGPNHTPMFGAEQLSSQNPVFRTIPAVNESVVRLHGHLRDIWDALGRAAISMIRVGPHHPDTGAALEEAHALLNMARQDNLPRIEFSVAPYGFEIRGIPEPFFAPEAPLHTVPYHLYSGGVRTMAFGPELGPESLRQLLAAILLDPNRDLGAEDDLGSALWDMDIPGLSLKLVTILTDLTFEQDEHLASSLDTGYETIREALRREVDEERGRAQTLTFKKEARLAELEARLLSELPPMSPPEGLSGVLLQENVGRLIHTHGLQATTWPQRLATTLADALEDAFEQDDLSLITAPLRALIHRMVLAGQAPALLDLYMQLLLGFGSTESRVTMNAHVLHPPALRALLHGLGLFDPNVKLSGKDLATIKTLLRTLSHVHIGVLTHLLVARPQDASLRLTLTGLIKKHLGTHPQLVAQELVAAPSERARAMLTWLTESGAWAPVPGGLEHPDPNVHGLAFDLLSRHHDLGFQSALGKLSMSPYETLRRRAMALIVRDEMRQFVPTLTQHFFSQHYQSMGESERRERVEQLHALHTDAAISVAQQWATREESPTRALMLDFLSRHGRPTGAPGARG